LLIQVDQLTASALACYGGPAVTPNIDGLAERSVVFEAAYANFPLCAPSRFSMLSGRLASEIGAYDNAAEFPASIPTFAHYLRAANQHTALVGKMHFIGPDQLHGYQERLTTDIYPSDFAWTFDPDAGREKFANDLRAFTNAGVVLRNPQLDFDDEVAHQARGKLYDLARSRGLADEQPWHLTVSFTHPHPPYQCRPEHWARYEHGAVPMPRTARIPNSGQDPYSLRLLDEVSLLENELDDETIRTARHAYLGSVSYCDDLIGSILAVLAETRLDSTTVVILTSDHGDMLGERGLWFKKSFFEDACRVPLMISWPARFASRRVSSNVSLVDLLPTLSDLAWNGRPPEPVDPLDGTSLIPLLDGDNTTGSDVVYGENLAEGTLAPIVMVKRGSMKYITGGGDPDQLFDTSSDADEHHNLAEVDAHRSTRDELAGLARRRWDLSTLNSLIQASQRRRLFLRNLGPGSWNYIPPNLANSRVLSEGHLFNEWLYESEVKPPG